MKKLNLYRIAGFFLGATLIGAGALLTHGSGEASQAGGGPLLAQATDAEKPAGAQAQDSDTLENALGSPDAPVTMIEYASLTCHHCANFHLNVWPALRERFVDTGKVRIIYRDFPLDIVALKASQLSHCVDPSRYFGFVKLLFAEQERWAFVPNPEAALRQRARLAGLSDDRIDACLSDEALQEKIINTRLEGQQAFDIQGTPTIVLNGRKFTGTMSIEALAQVVESQLNR